MLGVHGSHTATALMICFNLDAASNAHSLLHLQTFKEATIFNVQCNETDVVVWTAAEQVKLSNLAVFNKSLTVYGYTVRPPYPSATADIPALASNLLSRSPVN